jgi:ribosomal-protein-alanine N-acetyltransferase
VEIIPYFLTTRRLGFRPWREADRDLAVGLWGDERVTRLFDARGRWSVDQVGQRLAEEMDRQAVHGIQYWPIFRLADHSHVGCCGLRPHESGGRVMELGFHIRFELWRQGYASEAARAVVTHAFDAIEAAALFAGHHPDNAVSRRILARLGFRYTHDVFYPPTGHRHPSYLLEKRDA